jgi:2-polyprenyl-3-methyl-5-hydroxy-6-metoxy-1,4-benzoquinol methylase
VEIFIYRWIVSNCWKDCVIRHVTGREHAPASMNVVYEHTRAVHSFDGAVAGFHYLSTYGPFGSLLDVGAGTRTWMGAAHGAGVSDIWGIDGVEAPFSEALVAGSKFQLRDLSEPFDLNRMFDCVICLEVAEHLEESSANTLIASLCRHGNLIFFSAATPGQGGQNHANCQWPAYWQSLFNAQGFVCTDDVRWRMWHDADIEPWYRQNIFRAVRDPSIAGSEPRIASVVHPAMLAPYLNYHASVEAGTLPLRWYLNMPVRAIIRKVARHFR